MTRFVLNFIITFFFQLVFSPTSFSQFQVNHFTTENGLPSNGIKGLQWDESTGFLWIATEAGMVRYNGMGFATFDINTNPELGSNRIIFVKKNTAGTIFVGGETSLSRITETAKEIDAPPETTTRFHMWGVTMKVIVDNMPFGAGLGAFPQVYSKFDTLGGYQRVEQAHNDYLQVLADAGFVGLILGGVFLFAFFRQGFEGSRIDNTFRKGIAVGAFAGCFGVLVHSAFDFVLHITAVAVMFITLLAMLVSSAREYKDDIRDFDDVKPRRIGRSRNVTAIHERSSD